MYLRYVRCLRIFINIKETVLISIGQFDCLLDSGQCCNNLQYGTGLWMPLVIVLAITRLCNEMGHNLSFK